MFSCLTFPGLQFLRFPPPPAFMSFNGYREMRPVLPLSPSSPEERAELSVRTSGDDESTSPQSSPFYDRHLDAQEKTKTSRSEDEASDQGEQSRGEIDRSLSFSISNILSPEFGRRALKDKRSQGDDRSVENENENIAAAKFRSAKQMVWPAWVYCTRYSDRPSSGPRSRRMKKKEKKPEDKRPRTAFTSDQLTRLKQEFDNNKYLTEKRRQDLSQELNLNESQIKIWFQNKRAKIKKSGGKRGSLALHLMAQGLYNHSTIPIEDDDEDSTK